MKPEAILAGIRDILVSRFGPHIPADTIAHDIAACAAYIAAAENLTLRNTCVELFEALRECTQELFREIETRYDGLTQYPNMRLKYERDMETVLRASAVIDKARAWGCATASVADAPTA